MCGTFELISRHHTCGGGGGCCCDVVNIGVDGSICGGTATGLPDTCDEMFFFEESFGGGLCPPGELYTSDCPPMIQCVFALKFAFVQLLENRVVVYAPVSTRHMVVNGAAMLDHPH